MLLLVVVLFPFALLEFLTGTKLLNMVFGTVLSMREAGGAQQRLGFTRAATSFSHPIHFGLFASLVFANVYFLFWKSRTLWRLGAPASWPSRRCSRSRPRRCFRWCCRPR